MAQRKTLSDRQVELLRWIGDGCPDGVMADDAHRISAAALRRRGLVRISGRGPTWSARLTAAGRDYLAQVDGPSPPVPRQANVSVTQQLVDEVLAAEGVLSVPAPRWNDANAVNYRHRAELAGRYRKVPAGKRLEVTTIDDRLEIRLVDAPDGATADLVPVAVPGRVARYHVAARGFRDTPARHEVARTSVARATRIVHAIATEAERRGWAITNIDLALRQDGKTPAEAKKSHLQITTGEHVFWLRLREEGVQMRGPWEQLVDHYRNVSANSPWYRERPLPRGPYDAEASGRLKLELYTAQYWIFRGRQSRWADRQSWTLDERLPHLFRGIEERVVEADRVSEQQRVAAEQRAEAQRRAADERERRWHELMDQARHRLVETNRAARLRAQATDWQDAQRLRDYCRAVAERYGDQPATAEWLRWAEAYIDRLDPLSEPPVMPKPPEPTPEALQEHLPSGWSVRGPDQGRHMGRGF